MGGNTLGEQMMVNADENLGAFVNDANQAAQQAREKLSLTSNMLADAGVAMRTFLPKTGSGRAALATVMGGMFLIDGVKAFVRGGQEASEATNRQDLDKAATNFGNHMGMFAFDTVAGGYIGIKAEKLTGRFMENPVGAAQKVGGLADSVMGRFGKSATAAAEGETAAAASTYASRFGRYVEGKELGPKFAAWDKKVEHFWTSDESKVGNLLNRTTAKVDQWAAKFKPKEEPTAKNPLANIPPEQAKALMEQAQRQHDAGRRQVRRTLAVVGVGHPRVDDVHADFVALDPQIPATMPVRVSEASSTARAKPKSLSMTRSICSSSRMLAGFTSRCTRPC